MELSKRERLERTFGRQETDRPPVALWRHWPGDDQRAEDLASAQLHFQQQYDWDFIKVTPSSSFCTEDWGVQTAYVGTTEGTRDYLRRVIQKPADWHALPRLGPRTGALGRQLRCLELIAQEVGETVPFIQTVFNPLSVAGYLAGEDTLRLHIRQHPEELRAGLETITATTAAWVQELMGTGAAGIFMAVQHAQYAALSKEEYRAFGRPYDERILAATRPRAWFNLLHLHGDHVMFGELADYDVQVINWHDRETAPSLSEGQGAFGGAVCGGLRQWATIVRGSPDAVRSEAQDAWNQTQGRGWILGTGCVTPIVAPTSNLLAARQSVET